MAGCATPGMTIGSLDLIPSKFREGATTYAVSPIAKISDRNQGCHVPSFLNGRLRNARHDHRLFGLDSQQIPRRRNDIRRVTNCKNLRSESGMPRTFLLEWQAAQRPA